MEFTLKSYVAELIFPQEQEHLTVKDLWESIQDGTKEIKHFLRLLYLKETNHISQMLQML